jgi:hypothetical protein
MPLIATYTEELVRGMAPDEATFQKAQEIARAGKFQKLGVSSDGSWLLGECQGSATEPYQISADFHDAANPVLRSSSPSRQTPDKFSLGLLLAYLQDPNSFSPREPSDELLIKREKKIAFDEKKKSGSAAPRKINKAAPDKKLAAQREGLEVLEKLLVELVAGGHWFDPSRLEKIEKQLKHLSDASLPMATFGLRKLMLVAKQKDLNADDRMAIGMEVIASLWASISRVRAYLDQKLAAGETQADADAVIEDAVGKTWQLAELRAKGCFVENLSLFELAFERIDEEARQQRVEVSNLMDMGSGAVHQASVFRPFKGLSQVPEQTSYMWPLTVSEAAICPGFVNRRIRWEKGIEQLIENPPSDHLAKAYALAKDDFNGALEEFRSQLKHPLAPREAVFFLHCARIGRIGDRVAIQDDTGVRIELKDRRKDFSNVSNLVRAMGMMGKDKPALLVRLYMLPLANTVLGLPLAAVSPKNHLRLGV